MNKYWVSTPAYTIYVATNEEEKIIDIAPIARWAMNRSFPWYVEYLKRRFIDVRVEVLAS